MKKKKKKGGKNRENISSYPNDHDVGEKELDDETEDDGRHEETSYRRNS